MLCIFEVLKEQQKKADMKIQEAIKKIEEMGFIPSIWEKHGKQRIYIDFNFKGMTKKAGFIGRDKTNLTAPACGHSTKKYQDKLNEILDMTIEWSDENSAREDLMKIQSNFKHAAAQAKKEIEWQDWMESHDL